MGAVRIRLALLGLALGLAGCGTTPRTPPSPDPAVVAAHEWDHGPPWAPGEIPWVTPPSNYALLGPGYYDPYPWYWGPSAGIGFGVRRGYWWGRPRHFGFGPRHFGGGPRFFHGHRGGHRGRR